MRWRVVSGIRPRFQGLSQSQGQVAHVLLNRSPLEYPRRGISARLACAKHAASVRPEPGSNSPLRPYRPTPEATLRAPAKTLRKTIPAMNPKGFLPQGNSRPPPAGMATGLRDQTPNPAEPIKALAFNTLLSSQ